MTMIARADTMRRRRGPEETALDTWIDEQGPYIKLEVRSPKFEVSREYNELKHTAVCDPNTTSS